ncbi:MAG: hypothetical protein IKZ07_08005 [Akkermansia sp.]|nr:hypothetical protein [Akkermansia sp.]
MNKLTFALTALAAMPAMAGQVTPVAAAPANTDWTDAVKRALVVYDNKDTFVQKVSLAFRQQWQMAVVQPNGSNGVHLHDSASPFNSEFRRNWIGLNVDMASGTRFHTYVRMGGLPTRSTYGTGRTSRNFTYTGFYDIYLQQKIHAVDGLTMRVGKFAHKFTSDLRESNADIECVERSSICNQFGLDTNWGVEFEYKPNKNDVMFVQLFANDRACASKNASHKDVYGDGKGFKGEFGWEDKCFIILGGTHKFGVTEHGYHALSAEYLHDFNNAYHGKNTGANNYGTGFKDALSIGYEYKKDKLTVTTNAVAAFEQQKGTGTNNIGLQIQPVYAIHPQVDLVFRYVGMTGDGACKLGGDRYIGTQTTAPSWVDSMHTFYFGVDLYASAKLKSAAKLMFGAEYTTARKGGSDCYNGWEFTTAIRTNF